MKLAPHADLQTIKKVPIRNFVVLNLYPQEMEEEEKFDWTTTLAPPVREPHYSHAYGNGHDLLRMRVVQDEDLEQKEE